MRYLYFLLPILIFCQSVPADDDTGGGVKNMSEDEKISADDLLKSADAIFKSRDYDAALEAYLNLVESARLEFNRPVEIEATAQVARMKLILGDKEAGREWLEKALERASDSEPMGWSRYLGVKGRFEWQDNDLETARKTFEEMYTYCNTNALWSRSIDAAHMIAIVATTTEEQIKWGLKGINSAESAGVEDWLGPLWNNLAVTYYENKQFEEALEAFLKAREYHWRHSGEIGKLFADYHVGMTYRMLGQLEKSASWLRPVLAWAERLGNNSAIAQACEDMGEIAIAQGKKDEGLSLLKRAREEFKLAGYEEDAPDIWKHINDRISELEK